jgi:hypothetical protein
MRNSRGRFQDARTMHLVAGPVDNVKTNRIDQEYRGCVLHEHYQTAKGYTGESLNFCDPGRKRWHQTWVDNTGTLLLLDGNLQGRAMVMEGSTTDATGAWVTAFDGLYRRRAAHQVRKRAGHYVNTAAASVRASVASRAEQER